jgi:hypothetical protein
MLNIKQLAFLISLAWIIFAVSAELKTNEPQFIFAEFIRRKLEHDVQDLTPRSGNERNIISTIEPYSVQGNNFLLRNIFLISASYYRYFRKWIRDSKREQTKHGCEFRWHTQ